MSPTTSCPACGRPDLAIFYEVGGVPAHSVLLMPSREAALAYPRGDIALGFCPACGFITNTAFDPSLHEYSPRYEETQGFSPTFQTFHRRLAQQLIDRFDLHGKDIIEIGCGKGEFLALLCEMGGNRGIGFDPAFVPERAPTISNRVDVHFIPDFYSERYTDFRADFICCKMTLEHIPDVAAFVSMVRRSASEVPGFDSKMVVFFQVPDVVRVLREQGFWDIYYEHCSYFSPGSLARLFRRCGLRVTDLWTDYDDQYLMIAGRPDPSTAAVPLPLEETPEALAAEVAGFQVAVRDKLDGWRQEWARIRQNGRRVAIWGGGSKAVAFLTTLGVQDEVGCVVDINPYKQGAFLPGSGHEVAAPAFLQEYRPDEVILMNPIYGAEVRHALAQMGLEPRLLALT